MTDPTPTRAEVEAAVEKLANSHLGMSLVEWNAVSNTILTCAAENQALRERAEAAELRAAAASSDGHAQLRAVYCRTQLPGNTEPPADAHAALQQVREAARVDGWNGAVAKVADWHTRKAAEDKDQAAAYRKEGSDDGSVEACLSDALCHLDCAAFVRALRLAAPTEGEA